MRASQVLHTKLIWPCFYETCFVHCDTVMLEQKGTILKLFQQIWLQSIAQNGYDYLWLSLELRGSDQGIKHNDSLHISCISCSVLLKLSILCGCFCCRQQREIFIVQGNMFLYSAYENKTLKTETVYENWASFGASIKLKLEQM